MIVDRKSIFSYRVARDKKETILEEIPVDFRSVRIFYIIIKKS